MLKWLIPLLISSTVWADICPKPWECSYLSLTEKPSVKIRAGRLMERAPFKGNILYYQGLADSMLNHAPLFTKLTKAGYRVIAYDYQGQGGSTGSMNDTRIATIPLHGDLVFARYARPTTDKKIIMGWSTGGLAAYMAAATRQDIGKIILIAPGIAPRILVGEGLRGWPLNEITMESLTSADYHGQLQDPHIDPIRPNSPLVVPFFSIDLLKTAAKARKTFISQSVKGLVLISGEGDSFVDGKKTIKLLKTLAPHFKLKQFLNGRHEIDNESEEISTVAHQTILDFLAI